MQISLVLANNIIGIQISMIFWWCKNISLHHHILDVVLQVPHFHHPIYATAGWVTFRTFIDI
jgi:hypothetical protein